MFNTTDLTPKTTSAGPQYLTRGVNEDVTLDGFYAGESSKGTPFLEVSVSKGADSAVKEKFYMSPAAETKSLEKVVHLLGDGLGVDRTALDNAGKTATSLDDYAAKLNKLIPKDTTFRLKLTGEEYLKKGTDEVKIGKRISFPPFAERTGSESKLKYDENNKYDYVKLPTPDASQAGDAMPASPVGTATVENDLPF